jgi:hypothetical protein
MILFDCLSGFSCSVLFCNYVKVTCLFFFPSCSFHSVFFEYFSRLRSATNLEGLCSESHTLEVIMAFSHVNFVVSHVPRYTCSA